MATFKPTVRGERKDGFLQVYILMVQNTKPGYIKNDKVVTKQMGDKVTRNPCTSWQSAVNTKLPEKSRNIWQFRISNLPLHY